MKRRIGCFLLLVLLLTASGCASQRDSFKFVHQERTDAANREEVSYRVDIGRQVGGASLTAELWTDGEVTKSAAFVLNDETKKLSISLLYDKGDEGAKGLNVQIDTDEVSGSLLTYFELPQSIRGYSVKAYREKEVIQVAAGEEMILVAMAFDTGEGVRVLDCRSFVDEPEKLKEYSCILVVRSAFTAEKIDPQAEAQCV